MARAITTVSPLPGGETVALTTPAELQHALALQQIGQSSAHALRRSIRFETSTRRRRKLERALAAIETDLDRLDAALGDRAPSGNTK
jgi:hypothetical protein